MKSEVFHAFFLTVMEYKDIDSSLVEYVNKQYEKAAKVKKKRIRLKKQKQALVDMYSLMMMDSK